MTSDFTIGDATKYQAIIQGNSITINDLQTFLNDWREIKSKAEKYDRLQKLIEESIQISEFIEKGEKNE